MPSVIIIVLGGNMINEFTRWESKVNKNTETGCWEWEGAKYRKGYGHFRRVFDGVWKMYKAHRFSYEYFNNGGNLLDKDICVCHKCDNPGCVNPEHLFVGSTQDNIKDKIAKGRHSYGIRQGYRIISEKDVLKIREEYSTGLYSMKEIAKMNNTSAPQVSRIINGKTHRKVGTED